MRPGTDRTGLLPWQVDVLGLRRWSPQQQAILLYLLRNGRTDAATLDCQTGARDSAKRISEIREHFPDLISINKQWLWDTRAGKLHPVTFYELTGEAAQLSLPLNCEGDD